MAKKLKYPILVSISPENQIRFFETNGSEINMCGHGAMAAAAVLIKMGGGHSSAIQFQTNPDYSTVNRGTHFSAKIKDDNLIRLRFPSSSIKREIDCFESLSTILGIHNSINAKCLTTEYEDVVLVLPNSHLLRNMTPNFSRLAQWIQKQGARLVLIAASSKEENFDWEIRALGPHWGLDDDLACGSANASIYPALASLDLIEEGKEYRNLYPYTTWKTGRFGGCQIVNFCKNMISLGGYCSSPVEIIDPKPFNLPSFLGELSK